MKKLPAIVPFSRGLLMTGSITGLAAQDSSALAPRATISNRLRDVKTKVEQALRKGDGRFTVSAMAEGDDPCYGTVKTLKVNYRLNGQPAGFAGTDPETVDLLEQE